MKLICNPGKFDESQASALITLVVGFSSTPTTLADDKDSDSKKPPEGFTPLFNGRDLAGWKDGEKQSEFWKVEDGALHYLGKGGKDLATSKNYKNFELWADWKLSKLGGDSGIFLPGRPQVQILGHQGWLRRSAQ